MQPHEKQATLDAKEGETIMHGRGMSVTRDMNNINITIRNLLRNNLVWSGLRDDKVFIESTIRGNKTEIDRYISKLAKVGHTRLLPLGCSLVTVFGSLLLLVFTDSLSKDCLSILSSIPTFAIITTLSSYIPHFSMLVKTQKSIAEDIFKQVNSKESNDD